MNWLMPEPASDIRAQIDALLDQRHPKAAVFAAPGNEIDVAKVLGMVVVRPEGTLITADDALRERFMEEMPDDAGMAAILGYPEPKDAAMAACLPEHLRVVQAIDYLGHVITEALCSPAWIERTQAALAPHGLLRTLDVPFALKRRFILRREEMML